MKWIELATEEIVRQVESNSQVIVVNTSNHKFEVQTNIPKWIVYEIISKHAPKECK